MAWGTGVHKNARLDEVRVGRFRVFNCRQRPTLPHSFPCSTIGGIRLNFRVRNGNGCDPDPMTTGMLAAWGPAAARFGELWPASVVACLRSAGRREGGSSQTIWLIRAGRIDFKE